MDKQEMLNLIQKRAKGERARVLFDMLMETLGADFSIKQHEVFTRLKEAVEGEQEAIMKMMPVHIESSDTQNIKESEQESVSLSD